MLIDRVLHDLDIPDPEERRGNPLRGSRLGTCARQLAYTMFHTLYPPAPLPARARLVFRFGDMIHDLVRREFRRVLPQTWGMEEEPFHFPVPLSVAEVKAALAKAEQGLLTLSTGTTDGPMRRRGLYLDTAGCVLWVPLHVDGITDLPGYGLSTVEIKSMASGSFRRALEGHVDYGYRVQMAAALEATELGTQVYVTVRKDTCHMLEIIYSKFATRVEVRFTKPSKLVETARVAIEGPGQDWESAELHHPFEPGLLDQARARVRKVLTAEADRLPTREYGPDFTCRKCAGVGSHLCGQCKGRGRTKKLGNPCGPCAGVGTVACKRCEGVGQMPTADLPWQCSYCPFVHHCWDGLYTLELTERPRYIVSRAAFEERDPIIARPEPIEVTPDPLTDTETTSDQT